jgi:hypothetical protein
MFLVSHLYQSIMLWFNLILTTAALCGTQLVPRFQIEFRLYKNRAARVILGYRNERGQSEAALSQPRPRPLLGW